MTVKAINHIAIVTEDIDKALAFWCGALGLELAHRAHVEAEAVDTAHLPIGDADIELIQPTDDESGVARYLAKRGAGIHHLCVEVDDIAAAMERLAAQGVQLINETPRTGEGGKLYAFVHPKSAGGVMVELYQLPS